MNIKYNKINVSINKYKQLCIHIYFDKLYNNVRGIFIINIKEQSYYLFKDYCNDEDNKIIFSILI